LVFSLVNCVGAPIAPTECVIASTDWWHEALPLPDTWVTTASDFQRCGFVAMALAMNVEDVLVRNRQDRDQFRGRRGPRQGGPSGD
jgi:hypothetical protein